MTPPAVVTLVAVGLAAAIGCADADTGIEPTPPPATRWIRPAALVGTWDYRGYFMHQAGCWAGGEGTLCLIDSTLEAFSGTVTVGAPRDSVVTLAARFWRLPARIEISVQQWDPDGACDGQALSCFTNRTPTATFSEVCDSVLEVSHDAGYPAGVVLRDGRVQWAWQTTDTMPVWLYDSLAAAPPPSLPGVRDLRKRMP